MRSRRSGSRDFLSRCRPVCRFRFHSPAAADARPTAPFTLGTLHVLPHLEQAFRQDEDLAFYYQIYGAQKDPATGTPRLDVVYIFLAPDKDKLAELGRVTFQAQAVEAHDGLGRAGGEAGGVARHVGQHLGVASGKVGLAGRHVAEQRPIAGGGLAQHHA